MYLNKTRKVKMTFLKWTLYQRITFAKNTDAKNRKARYDRGEQGITEMTDGCRTPMKSARRYFKRERFA